jgi:cellulose biosynthesis protein BcsQ
MKIAVYNFKGGVGKTSISLGYALNQGFAVVTNDFHSPLERVLSEEYIIKLKSDETMPIFDDDLEVVFDLGGSIDERAVSAIKQSDWVIIPTVNSVVDLHMTLQTINQVSDYNTKILVIVNKLEKGDFDIAREVITEFFPDMPIFPLKNSKIFKKMFEKEQSLNGIANLNGLNKYTYRGVISQFADITEFINNN